jgi:N-hydroxyarylamine O-acetyltransferase
MSQHDARAFDLPAYLRRVEYAGSRAATGATLAALHEAHATHIPFENLDVILGRGIALDIASLQAKLVAGRRGGYCFEQNLLFSEALRTLGFDVTYLAARVRLGTSVLRPRTHMTLAVAADGVRWLADVGFGAQGLLAPVPLEPRAPSRQGPWTFRVADEDGLNVLQSSRGDEWQDLYAFTLEPQHRVDYELMSHYTSTHPSSPFTQVLTAQRIAPHVRRILRDRDYSEDRGHDVTTRTLAGAGEIRDVLAYEFDLHFAADEASALLRKFPP